MDDEDIEYFQHMEGIKKKQLDQQHTHEEEELAAFRIAKNSSQAAAPISLVKKPDQAKKVSAPSIGKYS